MTQSPEHRPRYANTFRCIGPACEDTCCRGMGVLVDRKTYEKYQAIPQENIRSLVRLHISPITVDSSDTLYARINPVPSNDCPFLATDRLCGLQKEFGPEYLSATCSIYPRVLNRVDSTLETSLYLSCPEAARLVLLTPESTQLEGDNTSSEFRTDQFSRLASNNGAIHKPYLYFAEVQALVVTLIRDRTRPLWQRLFVLGLLCSALDKISTPERDSTVPAMIANYQNLIATGGLRGELNSIQARPELQLDVVLRLVDQRIRTGGTGERFLECWQDFLKGIEYSPESAPASDAEHFVQAEVEFYSPFFSQNPFVLENYLLNYVYRTLFPFGREASAHHTPQGILADYLLMITQYSMIKGLLVGMAGHYRDEFGMSHVVKLIQSFSRAVEHSPTFLKEINEFITKRNFDTIDGFATLLSCSEQAPDDVAQEIKPSQLPDVHRVGVA